MFILKPGHFWALAAGILLWAAIIFLPPWNPHAIFYVVCCAVIIVCFAVGSEILWHKKHPRLSRRISELEAEQDKIEGRD
jgi:hypothetical protein